LIEFNLIETYYKTEASWTKEGCELVWQTHLQKQAVGMLPFSRLLENIQKSSKGNPGEKKRLDTIRWENCYQARQRLQTQIQSSAVMADNNSVDVLKWPSQRPDLQ